MGEPAWEIGNEAKDIPDKKLIYTCHIGACNELGSRTLVSNERLQKLKVLGKLRGWNCSIGISIWFCSLGRRVRAVTEQVEGHPIHSTLSLPSLIPRCLGTRLYHFPASLPGAWV